MSALQCVCVHAPEQHGLAGCSLLGCDCQWNGMLAPRYAEPPKVRDFSACCLADMQMQDDTQCVENIAELIREAKGWKELAGYWEARANASERIAKQALKVRGAYAARLNEAWRHVSEDFLCGCPIHSECLAALRRALVDSGRDAE